MHVTPQLELYSPKDNSERVIAYGSKSLNKGEMNYCTTRREMLALATFTKHFRYYVLGKKFQVRTDNVALCIITKATKTNVDNGCRGRLYQVAGSMADEKPKGLNMCKSVSQ
jgi:hypothetical protein